MASLNKIERAHQMYRDGLYEDALGFYTEALAMARTKPQTIALHSNRAACYLKLHDFKKAAEECTSVLELDYMHTGALMLRAQTLVTLKEYNSALFDVNRLIDLNPSSEVYQNLHARLKTQVSLAPIPESEEELDEEEQIDELHLSMDYEENDAFVVRDSKEDVIPSSTQTSKDSHEPGKYERDEPEGTAKAVVATTIQTQISKEPSQPCVNGSHRIPKPGNDERDKLKGQPKPVITITQTQISKESPQTRVSGLQTICKPGKDQREEPKGTAKPVVATTQTQISKEASQQRVNGWQTIPKPKGHTSLNYARWDRVESDSSDDDSDENEEESQPQYRFRVKTVGVRPVK